MSNKFFIFILILLVYSFETSFHVIATLHSCAWMVPSRVLDSLRWGISGSADCTPKTQTVSIPLLACQCIMQHSSVTPLLTRAYTTNPRAINPSYDQIKYNFTKTFMTYLCEATLVFNFSAKIHSKESTITVPTKIFSLLMHASLRDTTTDRNICPIPIILFPI